MGKRLKYCLSILGDSVIAAMIGAAITIMTAGYCDLSSVSGAVYTAALVSVPLLFGLGYSRASGWVTLLMAVLACLTAMLFGWEPIEGAEKMAGAIAGGEGLEAHYDTFAMIAYSVIALFAFMVMHSDAGGAVMMMISVTMLVLGWFFDDFTRDGHIVLLIAGVGAMFARFTRFRFSAWRPLLSITLIAALLSAWAVPREGITVPALEKHAQKALKFAMRILSIDDKDLEERRSFTIASGGWLSYKERLGGDAHPSDDQVLLVKSGEDVIYLRGAVRYVYNNQAWVDESNEMRAGKIKRYMLSGIDRLIYKSEYEQAFNLDKSEAKRYFRETSCEVEVLSDSSYWTIFTPDRMTEVRVEGEYGVYYNNVGEVFLNRRIVAGDSYRIEYLAPAHDAGEIPGMLTALSDAGDPGYRAALLLNRDLPSGIDHEAYELVNRITRDAETPYEKAAAICDYLKNNGIYTLKSDYAPEGTDAVSFFLSGGMRGYCAHFASAMAVLCRIAGLPARYAEGYLAKTDENGQAVVTGRDAHAWTEVYFEGYGWMTFDPTPSEESDNRADENENTGGEDNRSPEETPAPTPTPGPVSTPVPTPTPTPEPDWGAQTNPPFTEPTATPTPGMRLPDNTPHNPSGTEENSEDSGDDNGNRRMVMYGIALLFLLLLAAALFVIVRLRLTNPVYAAQKAKNHEDKLMVWYRAMLTALEAGGIKYEAGETPVSFAGRARAQAASGEAFEHFSKRVTYLRYSGQKAEKDDYAAALEAYKEVASQLNPFRRAAWRMRRVFFGIGRLHPVP